ncbi:MAG: PIN domain-containing protein [Nitrococcus mobilis]|nr:PIN domain-containing protein [Nitrococcus mobilis]
MIAVDTNVLVRILTDDPGQPEQVQAARALASRARKVYVPLIVMVECVWVLGPVLN